MPTDHELESYSPLDPATIQCPFSRYSQLRAESPVHHVASMDVYVVTRHDLVAEVLRDPATYSSRRSRALVPLSPEEYALVRAVQDEGLPRLATLLTADPPKHTRYRRLVSKAFSPPSIAGQEMVIRSVANELIDGWIERPTIEFVTDFGVPLPVVVIAKALNVPNDRLDDFKRWSDDTVVGFGNEPTVEELLRAERGVNELQEYFSDELDKRRTRPQDDLLTGLLTARVDDDDTDVMDGRALEIAEILSIIHQLLVGGNETTTKMLTEMMVQLATHPDQWERVKYRPEEIPAVIEEVVRLASPIQAIWRVATRDVLLGGTSIPAGARIVITYGSANRDESVFPDADAFDPNRPNITDHLGFGRGVHFCVGASLARLEGRIALEELSRRVHTFNLSATNQFEYYESFMLRGLTSLDLDIVAV